MEDAGINSTSTKGTHNGPQFVPNDFFALLGVVARYCVFFLFGVAGLLLVSWYPGPFFNLVHSYGGNITAPFAFYFIIRSFVTIFSAVTHVEPHLRSNRTNSALTTLLVAELFEATNGFFGLMRNVYDPLDYLVNAFGVALALAVDLFVSYVSNVHQRRIGSVTRDFPHDRVPPNNSIEQTPRDSEISDID